MSLTIGISESTSSVSHTAIPSAFYLVGAGNYVTQHTEQYTHFCSSIAQDQNTKMESMAAIEEKNVVGPEPCGVTAPPMHPFFSRSLEGTNQRNHLLSITLHRHRSGPVRTALHSISQRFQRWRELKRLYLDALS
jgi:hypothetical protein